MEVASTRREATRSPLENIVKDVTGRSVDMRRELIVCAVQSIASNGDLTL